MWNNFNYQAPRQAPIYSPPSQPMPQPVNLTRQPAHPNDVVSRAEFEQLKKDNEELRNAIAELTVLVERSDINSSKSREIADYITTNLPSYLQQTVQNIINQYFRR